MQTAQAMYGRDRVFSWCDDQVALGGNLLHLLPEDRFDRQPVWSADRTTCLVADVRLDNRADLVRELGLTEPELLADSDVLLSAWMRWGAACLDHVIGGFAFAVWTPARRELFAARDHSGDRPLFYVRNDEFFALSSMPKGLLVLPGVFQGLDEACVADCLANLVLDQTRSFFAGITRLRAGHFLRMTPDKLECRRYWHPTDAKPIRFRRDEEYAEALVEIFDRATESRLRSTKEIGSHLSAGLDSGSVTSSAATILATRGKGLTAFTSVPRPEFEGTHPFQMTHEAPYAAALAAMYPNIDHVLVDSTGCDLMGTMRRWTDAMDEPALNVVNFCWVTRMLEQAGQRGIGVMLEGIYGNGTISWDTDMILSHFFRGGRWIKLMETAASLRSKGETSIRPAVFHALRGLLPEWMNRRLVPQLYGAKLDASSAAPALIARYRLRERFEATAEGRFRDLRSEHVYLFENYDMGTYHAATRAIACIDPRDPTADKRVYEFCFGIPPEQFVVGGHSRSLVRRAMRGRMPEATLGNYRRGFQSPDWYLPMTEAVPAMQAELTLQEASPALRGVLDFARMRDVLEHWDDAEYGMNDTESVGHAGMTLGLAVGYLGRTHEGATQASATVEDASSAGLR